jgi:hypothetical protein
MSETKVAEENEREREVHLGGGKENNNEGSLKYSVSRPP